jgi:hypothetical protein
LGLLRSFAYVPLSGERGVKIMNREEWLTQAVENCRPLFDKAGTSVPELVRVSCGWPSTGGLSKKRRLGECWHAAASSDGVKQIFVTPLLSESKAVLSVLVHELCHAALEDGVGHKGPFKKLGKNVGLIGPAKQMQAGPELENVFDKWLETVVPYPQGELRPKEKKKAQKGRMLKIECPGNDNHVKAVILRGAHEAIQKLPTCWCGREFLFDETQLEKEEEDEE